MTKTNAITLLIIVLAFVICGAAWMRFFWAAALNPSPVRYVEYEDAGGPRDPFHLRCAGPSFIDADSVWRFCQYGESALGAVVWGLVRYDLADGKAQLRWPLPDQDASSQILALAKAPNGDLAIAWGTPELSQVYRIYPAGGLEALGLPDLAAEPSRGQMAGVAWSGADLEIVTQAVDIPPTLTISIWTYAAGAWQARTQLEPPPQECGAGVICSLQMAHRAADGWRFVYTRAPRTVTDPATTPVDLLLATESGSTEQIDSVMLADLSPVQYTLVEDDQLIRLGDLFDRSPGNMVNWSVDAAPFVLHGGTWKQVTAPQANASFYFSDYRIGPDGLQWIPGLRYPARGWQVDDWLMLRSTGEGLVLATFEGESGPELTSSTVFMQQEGAQTSLLPASDGGYWLLGPNGAYLKVNASLKRADELTLVERVERAFNNFGALRVYNGAFYQDRAALKMLAFPLVLLSLPGGYLLIFFVRQIRRNNTQGWITWLLRVSAVYLVLATVFIWWYWEAMGSF